MALSDYGTFIVAMAYFGEPDSATLKFISENYGESYTPAALSQFRKRNQIHKNSRAEYIAIKYGTQIVERFNDGETVKKISSELGCHAKHVSAAIKGQGQTTERRCTQVYLLANHRHDLLGLISRGKSCRDAADWLQQHRKLICSKNVVLETMKTLTGKNEELQDLLRSISWVFTLSDTKRDQLLKDLIKALGMVEPSSR